MRTAIITGSLLVTLLAVGLAPAASAEGTLTVTFETENAEAEYDTQAVECENRPFSTGPAFRDRVYSNGDCDVHVEKNSPVVVACRTQPHSTGPEFSFRVWTDGDCVVHASL